MKNDAGEQTPSYMRLEYRYNTNGEIVRGYDSDECASFMFLLLHIVYLNNHH
jgi:hypothetical protein